MSTLYKKSLIFIVVISAGVLTIGYFFFWRKGKKKLNRKESKDVSLEEPKIDKDETMLSNKGIHQTTNKSPLEVTTSCSLEINKKSEFTITKQVNFFVEKKSDVVKEEELDKEDLEEPYRRIKKASDQIERKEYKEEISEGSFSKEKHNSYKRKVSLKTNKQTEKEIPTKEINRRISFNLKDRTINNNNNNNNNTILNIVNEMKLFENINDKVKQYAKNNKFDPQTSIYLPLLTRDIEDEINLYSDEGYLEEDDDDLNELEGNFIPNEEDFNLKGNLSEIVERQNIQRKRHSDNAESIATPEDLNLILFSKTNKRRNAVYNIQTEFRIINDGEKIEIIKEELLLIILNYLYTELHSGLIELSDNFVEQRRFYFESDEATYVSIINLFLRKKEEFFLGVLSEIMSRLNISQTLLDSSFVYYMNYADQNDYYVEQIKTAYDKVYQAGIKKTISPKNLNKPKLKEILAFQCEKYKELMKQYSENLDMIEVMVTDYTYIEYGFDREAIKSAMNKLNVYDSDSFGVYLKKLDDYQKNSFLNI